MVHTSMIDLIMATHNHLGLTIPAIEALYEHTTIPFTLTVVDDSTDMTPDWVNWWIKQGHDNTKLIHSDTSYTHGAQVINIGLKNTQTPIVGYLGNSTRVEPFWLDFEPFPLSAWKVMNQEQEIGIMGFKLVYTHGAIEHAGMYWTPEMPHHFNFGVNEPGHRYPYYTEVPAVGFALILLRRTVFPNGLDEKTFRGFRGYDDLDECFAARQRGWRIVYCGLGAAYHFAGATRHSNDDQYFQECEENRQIFLNKWGGTDKAKNSTVATRVKF